MIREYKEIYSNSGELFENVKSGKNFGYKHEGQPLKTTKGISQYDYFSKTGKRVKLLGKPTQGVEYDDFPEEDE